MHEALEDHARFLNILGDISIHEQPTAEFFNDPDPGPMRAWHWAYSGFPHPLRYQPNDYTFIPERACGYVFWDEERLVTTGFLDRDCDDIGEEMKKYYRKEEEMLLMVPSFEEQRRSVKVREVLFRKGLSGYCDIGFGAQNSKEVAGLSSSG